VTADSGKLRNFVLRSVKRTMNDKKVLLRQRSAIFAIAAVAGGIFVMV